MAKMTEWGIYIENLAFHYPGQSHLFFSNLNLAIPAGRRFGLFGPNGAGKTTLMSLMTGLLRYESGTIQLLGHKLTPNNRAIQPLFGYVPQDFSFYQELSPAENLEFFGAWAGLTRSVIRQRSDELLSILGLQDVCHRPVHTFSGGMKRRVNLAIAVIHEPRLLFLDEPTVGVDVQSRISIIQYLKSLNENGTTLIYTSHQLLEAEELCESIALIDNGKIIASDTMENLLAEYRQEGLEGLFLKLTGRAYRD